MKLFAVIVLYKMLPADSPSLASLTTAIEERDCTPHSISVLIWDNTPGGQTPAFIPSGIRYKSAPENPGLAKAYNEAIKIARSEGFEWFLTLDQDTILPRNFISEIGVAADRFHEMESIAAIVPRVVGDDRFLSPFWFSAAAIPRVLRSSSTGVWNRKGYAVNSAATIRISSLCEIGGYNPLFPLDISDIDLFHRLNRAGKSMYVADHLVAQHEFSLLNKTGRMSLGRYRAQLYDECAFWDMNMGALARLERMARLAGRLCKDIFKAGSREFQRCTASELRRRLTTRRKDRIRQWEKFAASRARLAESTPLTCSGDDKMSQSD